LQVAKIWDVVHAKGAPHAALFVVGAEHEVVQDKLFAAGEEIWEGFLAIWCVKLESSGAFNLDYWQCAAGCCYLLEKMGGFFLLFEEIQSSFFPFDWGDDLF
jgi:hypothetical protein